jgi:uncharacterized protein (DUF2141 family)
VSGSPAPYLGEIFMNVRMIALPLAFSLAIASASAFAQTKATCGVIEFTGLTADQGTLQVAVYGAEADFFKKPVWVQQSAVKGETARLEVCDLAVSEIAVTAFQDLNGNNKMDSNPLGIPSEPYGASGKPPKFSAPTWATSKVSWPGANGAPVIVKF